MEEQPVGIEARSNDYMDGINDMILLLQAHDLKSPEGIERLWRSIDALECNMNSIRQYRFIEENGLARMVYKHYEMA